MRIFSLALLLLLTACSGAPVDTQYYLLRDSQLPDSRSLSASTEFALGRVQVASYIDQPGLVLEVGGGQIRPAMHHQWAEPMHQSVRSFLQTQVGNALGEDLFPAGISPAQTVLEIRIDQLHGTRDGQALLMAYWWLRRDNEVIASHQFSERRALQQDGYAALADAERGLLAELARRIADTLKAASQGG